MVDRGDGRDRHWRRDGFFVFAADDSAVGAVGNGDGPLGRGGSRANSRLVVHERHGLQRIHLLYGQVRPTVGVGVESVHDCFEVEVASRGPTGGANLGNDFADADRLALRHSDGLKMVVGGDQAVAVFDLHPVTATPDVPANRADHAGVGRINTRSASCSVVLPPVELTGQPGQWAVAVTVGGTRIEDFERGVKAAGGRTGESGRSHRQPGGTVLAYCPDHRPVKEDHWRAGRLLGGRLCGVNDHGFGFRRG
ncbi:hypothetical protein PJL18_02604 [Paenarthrobacter nicotinovorans]|nr:hypothetical protein [Paenarthrobacter nicotinovorans]